MRWRPASATLLGLAGLLGVSTLLVACGGSDDDANGGRLRVVASTAVLADLAEQLAGDDAAVFAVIPAGADTHGFAPSPDAARRVAEADVVVVNGYGLEGSTLDVILANVDESAALVVAAAGIAPLDGADPGSRAAIELARAEGDPHLWLSVRNAMLYLQNIAAALVAADPEHAAGYREREERALAELQALDEEVRAAVAAIPRERRTLVVFHDAFRYFAAAYGLELAAAVLPASPGQQASAGDLAAIIELVRKRRIPAIYAEPQFASDALDTVADETGARVLTLYSGAFADEVDSYAVLMRANAAALVAGLAE